MGIDLQKLMDDAFADTTVSEDTQNNSQDKGVLKMDLNQYDDVQENTNVLIEMFNKDFPDEKGYSVLITHWLDGDYAIQLRHGNQDGHIYSYYFHKFTEKITKDKYDIHSSPINILNGGDIVRQMPEFKTRIHRFFAKLKGAFKNRRF